MGAMSPATPPPANPRPAWPSLLLVLLLAGGCNPFLERQPNDAGVPDGAADAGDGRGDTGGDPGCPPPEQVCGQPGLDGQGADGDGDGWGHCCDCDDGDAAVHPGAEEVCNGRDDDCDGRTDGGPDSDGDGFGVCDCDDGDAAVYPGAAEDCNGIDDDCDGASDEGLDVRPCPLQAGVCTGALERCEAGGWSGCDYGPDYELEPETRCDGLDNDCDGASDEELLLLEPEAGAAAADGLDNNCNGLIDEPGGVLVPVPSQPGVWIMAYEAAVFAEPDCSGTHYGAAADDYPAGWPAQGESTIELYACSLPGVLPAGHLSFYRARRACRAQGMRLCKDFEYRPACDDNSYQMFPYANVFVPGVCNDPYGGSGAPAPSGSYAGCTADGTTFDMSGNLAEWANAQLPDWPDIRLLAGGSYACSFCFYGGDCLDCDPDNGQHDEIIERLCQCPIFDFVGGEFVPYRAYPRATAYAHFGTRCCYEPDPP
jgi:hypothetical protein